MPRTRRPTRRKDRKQEFSGFKNPERTEALVAILDDDEGICDGLLNDPKERKGQEPIRQLKGLLACEAS